MPPFSAMWLPPGGILSGSISAVGDFLTTIIRTLLIVDAVVPPLLYVLLRGAEEADRLLGWGAYRPGQTAPPSNPAIHMRQWRRAFLSRIKFVASLEFAFGFMAALIGYTIVGGNPIRFALYAILLVPLFVLLAIVPGVISVYLAERANTRRRYATLSRRAPLNT